MASPPIPRQACYSGTSGTTQSLAHVRMHVLDHHLQGSAAGTRSLDKHLSTYDAERTLDFVWRALLPPTGLGHALGAHGLVLGLF